MLVTPPSPAKVVLNPPTLTTRPLVELVRQPVPFTKPPVAANRAVVELLRPPAPIAGVLVVLSLAEVPPVDEPTTWVVVVAETWALVAVVVASPFGSSSAGPSLSVPHPADASVAAESPIEIQAIALEWFVMR